MRLFPDNHGIVRLKKHGKKVLVIRRNDQGAGLFAHFAANLGWMRWAVEKKGMIPYVDMRTTPNAFNRGSLLPFNPWECFFQQCDGCGEEDLLRACRVYVTPTAAKLPPDWPRCDPGRMQEGNPEMLSWRSFVHEHVAVAPEMLALADQRRAELFESGDRVLGCLLRGTDYVQMKPKWHPVQPTIEQAIADVGGLCDRFSLNKVFLASEDQRIIDSFRSEFGDMLVTNQTLLPSYKSGFLMSSGAVGDGMQALAMSKQYMVSILLLSQCQFLLAGCTSGSVAALLLSRGYKHCQVYNLGIYQ